MQIKVTKKLLSELGVKPVEIENIDPLFSWHANIALLNRCKIILLLNDATKMVILLYGLKAPNLKKLDSIILNAIKETLIHIGVNEDLVKKYLEACGEVSYVKASNTSILSKLNHYLYDINTHIIEKDTINQVDYNTRHLEVTYEINGEVKKVKELIYEHFNELFLNDVNGGEKTKLFKRKALKFKMAMGFESLVVWREIIVPFDITFKKLHFVIQDSFSFLNYHLHEFTVFNNDEEPKPIALIGMNKEEIGFAKGHIKTYIENIKLETLLPEYNKVLYVYDFGDNWQVFCELSEIVDDYEFSYPTCTAGGGDAPPEDVGGEGGFIDFKKAYDDGNDPEHDEMVEWAEDQGYSKWNIDDTNKKLMKSLIRLR